MNILHQTHHKNSHHATRYATLLIATLILMAICASTVMAESHNVVKTLSCENCGQIEGLVWNDRDWNGLQTRDERGIASVFVRLWMLQDGKYQIHRAYYTGRDGAYIFDDLDIGSYRVEVVEPHSISLQHHTQTTLMSPTPVIELQDGQTMEYNFSYAEAGFGMQTAMMPHSYKRLPPFPMCLFPIGQYGPYPEFKPPAVFLNPYEGEQDQGKEITPSGEKFSKDDIIGVEGGRQQDTFRLAGHYVAP